MRYCGYRYKGHSKICATVKMVLPWGIGVVTRLSMWYPNGPIWETYCLCHCKPKLSYSPDDCYLGYKQNTHKLYSLGKKTHWRILWQLFGTVNRISVVSVSPKGNFKYSSIKLRIGLKQLSRKPEFNYQFEIFSWILEIVFIIEHAESSFLKNTRYI